MGSVDLSLLLKKRDSRQFIVNKNVFPIEMTRKILDHLSRRLDSMGQDINGETLYRFEDVAAILDMSADELGDLILKEEEDEKTE